MVLDSSSPPPTATAISASTTFSGMTAVAAGVTESVSVSSLAAGYYRFYAFFEDSASEESRVVGTDEFLVTVPGTVFVRVPDLNSRPPAVSGPNAALFVRNSGMITCTLRYTVLADSATAPDATAVATASETPGATSGAVEVLADRPLPIPVYVTPPSDGSYIFYAVFDHGGTFSSVSRSLSFDLPDPAGTTATAPTLGSPSVAPAGVTISVGNVDPLARTLHYVVLDAALSAPNAGALWSHAEAQSLLLGASANGSVFLPGLTAGSYKLHAFFSGVQPFDGVVSSVSSTASFAPSGGVVVSVPSLSPPSADSDRVEISVNNPGTSDCIFHYAVLSESAGVPSAADVRLALRSVSVPSGDTVLVSVSGLRAGTYVLHGFFEHSGGAISDVSSSDAFTLVGSVSYAPSFAIPSVTGTDAHSIGHEPRY